MSEYRGQTKPGRWEKLTAITELPNSQVATSLPRQFVVPAHVTDDKLAGVAGLGLGTRPPVWVGADSHFGFWVGAESHFGFDLWLLVLARDLLYCLGGC